METILGSILGSIVLILFLFLVIKVCISSENKENKSVVVEKDHTLSDERREGTSINREQISAPMKNSSSDVLINSPYYNKYKDTFDYIRYFGKEPKYRIDWLLKSLDMGHELEYNGVFVTESIKSNFPYFCETEEEFEALSKDDGLALKGSVVAIFALGYLYYESNTKSFLPEKRIYWRNKILEMAKTGNLDAQAGLCRKNLLFTEQEVTGYKSSYEAKLIRMAEEGNPHAQLAVGQFIVQNRKEKIEWLNKAGEQGLSDAYYYLSVVYTQMRFLDDEFKFKQNSLSEKDEQLVDEKIGECYLKGAKLNNGIMAAECQYMLGAAYHYGYYGLEKDLVHARYWYGIAFENGKIYAGTCIEEIDK